MLFKELGEEYYELGVKLAFSNNLTGAIKALKRALSIDSENWKSLNLLGLCLYKYGSFSEARACFLKSESIYSGSMSRASDYLQSFEEDDFIKICHQYNDALAAAKAGKFNAARKILMDKVFPSSDYCCFSNLLGLVNLARGEKHSALAAFKKALEIDSGNEAAIYYLNENWDDLKVKATIYGKLKEWLARR